MAEARQAVRFHFAVSHDGGIHLDYDWEVLKLIFHAGTRAWKKAFARGVTSFKNRIFPLCPELVLGSAVLLGAIYAVSGLDLTFGLASTALTYVDTDTFIAQLLMALLASFIFALLAAFTVRCLLRLLYSYQGWMYLSFAQSKNPPLHIRLWFIAVKALTSLRKICSGAKCIRLYSFQGSCPPCPCRPSNKHSRGIWRVSNTCSATKNTTKWSNSPKNSRREWPRGCRGISRSNGCGRIITCPTGGKNWST